MFNALANALANSKSNNSKSKDKKRPNAVPSVLRDDLYKAIQEAERWLSTSTPGDGYSYRPTHAVVFPHYPELEIPLGCGATEEVAILVGTITDIALEIGSLDAFGGVIVMRSWVDSLERVIKAWKTKAGDSTGTRIVDGIVQGVNYKADSTLLCKDFAPRVQTINVMKRVAEVAYGKDAQETRQSEALWGSRLISM